MNPEKPLRKIDGPLPPKNRPGTFAPKITTSPVLDRLRSRITKMRDTRKREERYAAIDAQKPRTYTEGRPELFETKVFNISRGEKNVVVFSRDPGSAAALIPVMKILQKERVGLSLVTDGRAEEAMRKAFPTAHDVTPENPLEIESVIDMPDLILTDTSASDRGLETFAAATFSQSPIVLVEDYYTTAKDYLSRIREMNPSHAPEYVCVMDAAARDIVLKEFPELADRVVITGQPAFDRFATEKTTEIRTRVREELGLGEHDRLIVYMGTGAGQIDETKAAAEYLARVAAEYTKATGGTMYISFRKHPRDNTSDATYAETLSSHGVEIPERAATKSTNDIAIASDVVITSWSTAGLDAAFRRIPVLYINDSDVRQPPSNQSITYPLPPVTLGAGAAVYHMHDIPSKLLPLLDRGSMEVAAMTSNMEQHYKKDGTNAENVARLVRQTLKKSS